MANFFRSTLVRLRTLALLSAWVCAFALSACLSGCKESPFTAQSAQPLLPDPSSTQTSNPVTDPSASPTPSPTPTSNPTASPSPAAADHLSMTGPASNTAGQCSVFILSARNSSGGAAPLPPKVDVQVQLRSNGPGHFYMDGGCRGEPIDSLILREGQTTFNISYSDTWAGPWTLSASEVGSPKPLKAATSAITILPGAAHHIVLRGPDFVTTGSCVGPFTLVSADIYGNAARVTQPTTVTLNSASATLFSTPNCAKRELIRSLTLSGNNSVYSFYASQATAGELSIFAVSGATRGEYHAQAQAQCRAPKFDTQPWDVFQTKAGQRAVARSMAIDSKGRVLVAGVADQDFQRSGVVRRGDSTHWETVDSYQSQKGFAAESLGLTSDPQSGWFLTGGASDSHSTGAYRLFLRRSAMGPTSGDPGTWNDGFGLWNYSGAITRPTQGSSALFDSYGRLVVRGTSLEQDGSRRLVFRVASPDFSNWVLGAPAPGTLVGGDGDDPTALGNSSQNLAIDRLGLLWTTTAARTADGTFHWFVLKSADFGVTWTSMDGGGGFQLLPNLNAFPRSIAIDTNGRIFVVGTADTAPNQSRWVVRKSVDGGATWETIDAFKEAVGKSEATALLVDSFGGVYVTGRAVLKDRRGYELVVRYSPRGDKDSFATQFQTQLDTGKGAAGRAIIQDAFGSIYVAGSAQNKRGENWIVHRAQCK